MVKRNGIWVLMPQRYGCDTVWYADAEVYLGSHMLQKFSGDAIITLTPPSDVYIADGDVFGEGYPIRLPKSVADGFRAVGVPVSEDNNLLCRDGEMSLRLKEILEDVPILKVIDEVDYFLSPEDENYHPQQPIAFVGTENGVLLMEYQGSHLTAGIGYFRFKDGLRSEPILIAISEAQPPYYCDLDRGYLWDGNRWWAIEAIPC